MNYKMRLILVLICTLVVAILYAVGIVPALAASVFITVLLLGTALLMVAGYLLKHPLNPH